MNLKNRLRRLLVPVRARIRGGPCAGMRWSLFTRLRFLSGTYEARMADFVAQQLRQGEVFWDVGAHFGYYTLIAARAVGPEGAVHSFEPSSENRRYLDPHVRWNRLGQVTVHGIALADAVGESSIGGGRGPGAHRLGKGTERVAVHTVDSLVEAKIAPAPDWMKIDVQGREAEVLRGAGDTLRNRSAAVACATHSPELHTECLALLEDYGFRTRDDRARKVILAFGAGREMPEFDIREFDM